MLFLSIVSHNQLKSSSSPIGRNVTIPLLST
jgi:hypothetical protein